MREINTEDVRSAIADVIGVNVSSPEMAQIHLILDRAVAGLDLRTGAAPRHRFAVIGADWAYRVPVDLEEPWLVMEAAELHTAPDSEVADWQPAELVPLPDPAGRLHGVPYWIGQNWHRIMPTRTREQTDHLREIAASLLAAASWHERIQSSQDQP
jgi:hypothetical protein